MKGIGFDFIIKNGQDLQDYLDLFNCRFPD